MSKSALLLSIINVMSSLCIYFLLVGQPIWGTNDEVFMSGLAAGVWGGLDGPSSDLFYLHKGYSWVLQQLYLMQVEVPWYALSFILLLTVALFIINYAIFRLQTEGHRFFIIATATLGTTLPALWHLQHTVVAGIISIAGGVLFLSLFSKRPATERSLYTGISLVLALLVIGSMIRFTSLLMVATLFAPLGIVFYARILNSNRKSRQHSRILRLPMLVPFLIGGLIFIIQWLNMAAYSSDSNWLNWCGLSQAKKEFIDYDRIAYNDQTSHLFDRVGWSETDFNMIKTWQYADIDHFSLKKFENVIGNYPKETIIASIMKMELEAWKLKATFIARSIYSVFRSVTLLPLILLVIFCNLVRQKSNLLYVGVVFTATILILIYLFFELNRAPFRVLIVLLLGLVWLLIFLTSNFDRTNTYKSRGTKPQGIFSLLIISLVLNSCWLDLKYATKVEQKAVDKQRDHIRMLATWNNNLPKSSIIYNIGSSFQFEAHLPLMSFEYMRALDGFITMGWINQSPLQRAHFTSLGLDADFYGSLAQKKDIYSRKGIPQLAGQ